MLEHGAYRLLLDHYYAMRAPLPNDIKILYRICRAFTPSERKSVKKILSIFFTTDGVHYYNKRCDSEIAKLLKYSKSQSANAKLRLSHGNKRSINNLADEDNQKSIKNQGNLFHESHRSNLDNLLNHIDSESATAQPRAREPQPQSEKERKNPPTPLPDWIPRQDWDDWAKARKKKLTPRAIELTIAKLDELRKAGQPPDKVLQESIRNGWEGVFPLKNFQKQETLIFKQGVKTL